MTIINTYLSSYEVAYAYSIENHKEQWERIKQKELLDSKYDNTKLSTFNQEASVFGLSRMI